MVNQRVEELKSIVKAVLEKEPETLHGQKLVFSKDCGRTGMGDLQEFINREENTVVVLIYVNGFNQDEYHMMILDSFNATYIYSQEIKAAIKEKIGENIFVSFDHLRYNEKRHYCPSKIHAEIDCISKIKYLDIDFSKVTVGSSCSSPV